MMLTLFRRNLLFNYIALLVFTVAVQSYYLFVESTVVDPQLPQWIATYLENNPLLTPVLSIVLVYLQAVILSLYIIKNRISRALSIIPGAIFVLFVALVSFPMFLSTALVANLFCLLAIGSLFNIYKKFQPVTVLFNAGFFLSIAILIHPLYLYFVLLAILSIVIFRSLSLKEILQVLVGLATPIGLWLVYLYYNRSIEDAYDILPFHFFDFTESFELNIEWIKVILTVVISIVLIFLKGVLTKKKAFEAIKKIELMYIMIMISAVGLISNKAPQSTDLILASIPLSLLLGLYMERKDKNTIVKEFAFICMIGIYVVLSLDILDLSQLR